MFLIKGYLFSFSGFRSQLIAAKSENEPGLRQLKIKITILAFLLVIVLMLTSCGSRPDFSGEGNTQGNYNNTGYMVEDKNYIYDLWQPGGIKINKKTFETSWIDKDPTSPHDNGDISSISAALTSIFNGNIFFINDASLFDYNIKTNDINQSSLLGSAWNIKLCNNKALLFYTKSVLLQDLLTNKKRVILNDTTEPDKSYLDSDYLYYVNFEMQFYRVNLTTLKKEKLTSDKVQFFEVIGNNIYYNDSNGNLYKSNKDGSNKMLLANKVNDFNIIDGKIYYSNMLDKPVEMLIRSEYSSSYESITFSNLNVINLDKSGYKQICKDPILDIEGFDDCDKVLFYNYGDSSEYYYDTVTQQYHKLTMPAGIDHMSFLVEPN